MLAHFSTHGLHQARLPLSRNGSAIYGAAGTGGAGFTPGAMASSFVAT